jgi:hypothetical protein
LLRDTLLVARTQIAMNVDGAIDSLRAHHVTERLRTRNMCDLLSVADARSKHFLAVD